MNDAGTTEYGTLNVCWPDVIYNTMKSEMNAALTSLCSVLIIP